LDAELDRLKAERAAADREYNEALTRLDRAIQQLPPTLPDPPPSPDDQRLSRLTMLARARRFFGLFSRRQQAFNAAVAEHLRESAAVARLTHASMLETQAVLRHQFGELLRFQSLLVQFLQQITPYVDTRDRDVAGLLRGLSGAINTVADEVQKRSEATLARDRRREQSVADLDARLDELSARLTELQRVLTAGGAKRV
jgi:hypothetical protein